MESERAKAAIITKPAARPGGGKGEMVDNEKALLIKASRLPLFLQRRSMVAEDEEKKEKEMVRRQEAAKTLTLLPAKK